jgi:hypothetical protein
MSPIITHPAPEAHPDRDAAARRRADRLAKATPEQMQSALAFLSMIDDQAFEIAFTAVTPGPADASENEEPIPLCATCGAPIGIFPDITLNWRHYRGSSAGSGAQETYDPGHSTEPAWYLENEAAEQF